MPEFSEKSKAHLKTCRPELQRVFNFVVQYFDCSVISGRRGEIEQEELFKAKLSNAHFGESPHNWGESFAADVVPYPVDWRAEADVIAAVNSGDPQYIAAAFESLERFYHFAGFVLGVAANMNISLKWGGDWDRDYHFSDNRFNDLPHFELVGWQERVRAH